MAKLKLRGRDLKEMGYAQGKAIGIAINVMSKHHKRTPRRMYWLYWKKYLLTQKLF
jgi:hypothetical protein